jgi:hypothetical protein
MGTPASHVAVRLKVTHPFLMEHRYYRSHKNASIPVTEMSAGSLIHISFLSKTFHIIIS